MKKSLAISLMFAGAVAALGATSAQAIDTKARFMAANCAYCHGPEGKSRGAIPSLAGLEKKYFVDQMKAFRDGTRPATVMQKHAWVTPMLSLSSLAPGSQQSSNRKQEKHHGI